MTCEEEQMAPRAENAILKEELAAAHELIVQLSERLCRLEERVAKDSHTAVNRLLLYSIENTDISKLEADMQQQTQPVVKSRYIRPSAQMQPKWKVILYAPATKVSIGLIIGIGLLLLTAQFVNIPKTLHILQETLTTPQGIALALLSGVAFLIAFALRGVRWKLFLNPIGKVSTLKAIQLFLIGTFLNFLLPVRGGEVAKSLMLKRITGIPVSQSLSTVAIDKSLDLLPALFIMAIVPFLGMQMDIRLWLMLATASGLLIGLIFFTSLAAWKRTAAIGLLQKVTGVLPRSIRGKIAGSATGFVDSLLAGVSQPKILLPAVLLTVMAVIFDGLFAMLAFWTVGLHIPFGTAIFGHTVYNMFYILPTPPGQVGSSEAVGVLVFSGLLHLNQSSVLAMSVFSHPWVALLMCSVGMLSLSALGMTISSATKLQKDEAPLSKLSLGRGDVKGYTTEISSHNVKS